MADLFLGTQVHMVELTFKIKEVRLTIQSPATRHIKIQSLAKYRAEDNNPNACESKARGP